MTIRRALDQSDDAATCLADMVFKQIGMRPSTDPWLLELKELAPTVYALYMHGRKRQAARYAGAGGVELLE